MTPLPASAAPPLPSTGGKRPFELCGARPGSAPRTGRLGGCERASGCGCDGRGARRSLSPSQLERWLLTASPAHRPEILTPGWRVHLEGAGALEPPLSNPPLPPPIQARERPLLVQAQSCSERRLVKRTTKGEWAGPPSGCWCVYVGEWGGGPAADVSALSRFCPRVRAARRMRCL